MKIWLSGYAIGGDESGGCVCVSEFTQITIKWHIEED